MFKWYFVANLLDGKKVKKIIVASNKIDAIRRGIEFAKRYNESIVSWTCGLNIKRKRG